MAQITGKTVYVLGAGASCHTGTPLLNDFLFRAQQLYESKREQLKYYQSFENVFKWINVLRGSSYYLDFDRDNLEHVFSLADMQRQIGLEGGREIFSHLRYIIMETLDNCNLKFQNGRIEPDEVYLTFTDRLKELNERRKLFLKQEPHSFKNDVIISFNYDVMLDYAMVRNGMRIDYRGSKNNSFKLLKIHGSTNWAICKCEKSIGEIQEVDPLPLARGQQIFPHPDVGSSFPFEMVTNVLKNTCCKYCGEKGVLEPFILPPTWSKTIEKTPVKNVWSAAVEDISNASQIIVIGYSMPPTDTFFKYLLTLGLVNNPGLHRVIVIDKSNSSELSRRYGQVFSKDFGAKGKLIFLGGRTFETFVKGGMADKKSMKVLGSEI